MPQPPRRGRGRRASSADILSLRRTFLTELDKGEIRAAWVTGGYKTDWIDAPLAERFAGLDLLVVQDMFASPLWELATYQLPRRLVRRARRLVRQPRRPAAALQWAIRPPTGAWVEGALLLAAAGAARACTTRVACWQKSPPRFLISHVADGGVIPRRAST